MSSETEFRCNFCGREIVLKSTNEDYRGFCRPGYGIDYSKNNWSLNLYSCLEGPHICYRCLETLAEFDGEN